MGPAESSGGWGNFFASIRFYSACMTNVFPCRGGISSVRSRRLASLKASHQGKSSRVFCLVLCTHESLGSIAFLLFDFLATCLRRCNPPLLHAANRLSLLWMTFTFRLHRTILVLIPDLSQDCMLLRSFHAYPCARCVTVAGV